MPWFLQDLGTYGIGIFTPTILAAAIGNKPDHVRSVSDMILNDIIAAKGAALITVLLIVGIVFAVLLADRVGRIWLQVVGFIGCAAGLLIASFADGFTGTDADHGDLHRLHAVQLHDQSRSRTRRPTCWRARSSPPPSAARGPGFAAAFGKIGAVATAFLFPILLVGIGTHGAALDPRRHVAAGRGRSPGCSGSRPTGVNLEEIGR